MLEHNDCFDCGPGLSEVIKQIQFLNMIKLDSGFHVAKYVNCSVVISMGSSSHVASYRPGFILVAFL